MGFKLNSRHDTTYVASHMADLTKFDKQSDEGGYSLNSTVQEADNRTRFQYTRIWEKNSPLEKGNKKSYGKGQSMPTEWKERLERVASYCSLFLSLSLPSSSSTSHVLSFTDLQSPPPPSIASHYHFPVECILCCLQRFHVFVFRFSKCNYGPLGKSRAFLFAFWNLFSLKSNILHYPCYQILLGLKMLTTQKPRILDILFSSLWILLLGLQCFGDCRKF